MIFTVGVVSREKERVVDFSWEIPDFFSRVEDKEVDRLDSPSFSILDCDWVFTVSAGYLRDGGNMLVWVRRLPPYSPNKTVCWTIWLKKSDGTAENPTTRTHSFGEGETRNFSLGLSLDLSALRERRSELVPDGTLTIMCSMQDCEFASQTSKPGVPQPIESASQPSQTSELDPLRPVELEMDPSNPVGDAVRLASDLKGLLLSGESSDAVIRVKGQDFPVHRGILGARTPVFGAMFRHEMAESESGVVDIEDAEPETVQRFLEYVYTGCVGDLTPETAFSLYEMADKYQMEPLKRKCLDCIKSGLSVESFCQAITLAMKHDERELTTLATDFFVGNIKKIIRSDKWKRYLCENPLEANELLMKVHVDD